MSLAGTGKIWMNGKLVEWADAKIHIASHVIHYGSGVFEGARCYETPKGSAVFRLDAHMRPPDQLRQDLPDGVAARPAGLERRPCSTRSAPTRSRRATSGRSSTAGTTRSASTRCPAPSTRPSCVWEWGAYLGPDALEKGVDVQ